MQATFWELPAFSRYREQYLDDDEYRALQNELMRHPEAGDVIPSTGGLRKLRFGDSKRQKGKRGGLRIIYFWRTSNEQIWLFSIYSKADAADLTDEQRKIFRERLQRELKARSQEK